MLKNLKALLFSLSLVFMLTTPVYAQEEATVETTETVEDTEEVSDLVVQIYVDENCPHCKVVEAFVEKYGLEENVEYIQLSGNDENMEELMALWEEFDVDDRDQGWPFMVYEKDGEKSYEVGDKPINDFLEEEFNVEVDEADQEEAAESDSGGLLLLGGLFFFGIIGYVIYSMIFSKEE